MINRLFKLMIVVSLLCIASVASASVVGIITTDKDIYDTNDTIWITYNLSATGTDSLYTDLFVNGYLPTYNSTPMSDIVYFGADIFKSSGEAVSFKHVRNIKLMDNPESASSFIPIPAMGVLNAYVRPAIVGSEEYPDFLGKVRVYEARSNIYKDVYITREQPKIIITNISLDKKNAFTTSDTLIIHYFCKYNCSITAIDASLKGTVPAFILGIDPVTKYKTLNTSDTGLFKQFVIPLANTGYTPEDDFVRVTITDDNGSFDADLFFVYEPTADVLRINKNIVFDVGTDTTNALTFNNTIGIIYRTPDATSQYRLNVFQTSGYTSLQRCNPRAGQPYYFIRNFNIIPAADPDNRAEFFILNGEENRELGDKAIYSKALYAGFYNFFGCSDENEITTGVTFQIQQRKKFLWLIPYWSSISGGTTTASFHAERMNLVQPVFGSTVSILEPTTKMQLSIKPIIEPIGFRGTLGHLIFAVLAIILTFVVLTRIAKVNAIVSMAFAGIVTWYLAYDDLIDMSVLVIICVIVGLMYTTKLLATLRGEGKQPPMNEGEQ